MATGCSFSYTAKYTKDGGYLFPRARKYYLCLVLRDVNDREGGLVEKVDSLDFTNLGSVESIWVGTTCNYPHVKFEKRLIGRTRKKIIRVTQRDISHFDWAN